MKKHLLRDCNSVTAIIILSIILVLSAGCTSPVLQTEKEPPMLTIRTEESEIQAVRLTYSWQNGNYGVEADAMHPMEMADDLPVIDISEDGLVTLFFEKAPDRITVWAWKVSAAGTDAYDKPELQLSISEEYTMVLPSTDKYLYEVHAIWDRQKDVGGAAYYGFASAPRGQTAENNIY